MTNQKPDLTTTLTLISLMKAKATEQRSGWVLVFTAPIALAEMDPEDESEVKKIQHGVLRITRRSMYADPNAPQVPEHVKAQAEKRESEDGSGTVTLTFTGKLKRRNVGSKKESPPYSVWRFTLANRPQSSDLRVLMDMASADGDDVESTVEAEFTIKAEGKTDDPNQSKLSWAETDNEMSEEDKAILAGEDSEKGKAETLKKGEFEEEAAKKSKRKRKVEASA